MDLLRRNGRSPRAAELFTRVARWYTQLAILLLNTILLLSGITLAAFAYYAVRWSTTRPVYSADLRPRAIHRMSAQQSARFFQAFDRMGEAETYLYQPWVGFSERVFHAGGLNVDEAMPMPTRRTWQDSERRGQPLVVWTFGGSTMFGWGVPDDETIASHVAKMLARRLPDRRVTVINHGHSYFFSSQELVLFQTLLRRGERCDFAIFLDGLNDSLAYSLADTPAFSDRMRAAFEKEQSGNPTAKTYLWISPEFPPLRLLAGIARRLGQRRIPTPTPQPAYDTARKYQVNMTAEATLGAAQGIRTLFFWQPVPGEARYAPARELADQVRRSVHSSSFHSVADLFNGTDPDDVYVDLHHYGDTACERLGEAIAREILAEVAGRQ